MVHCTFCNEYSTYFVYGVYGTPYIVRRILYGVQYEQLNVREMYDVHCSFYDVFLICSTLYIWYTINYALAKYNT